MNNLLPILTGLLLTLLPANEKNKISEWRGKDRQGIYDETNLLKSWPAEGPKEIWAIDNIGEGFCSPVFTDDNFYITGEIDSMDVLFCFNLKGEKQWQTNLGKEWMKSCPGSRSAPTVVDDLIYTGSGFGTLFCIDRANGKIIWSKKLAEFEGILPMHGHSESPLISNEKIFWTPGGKDYNVVAMNRFTGKLIWSNKGFSERSAYNSPKLVELPSRKLIITFSAYHLMAFDTETGKLLWSHEQTSYAPDKRMMGNGDTHCNTVLYDNGAIYYVAGDGNRAVKLRLSEDGSKITEVWRNNVFDGYMGGIVKIGNFIYGGGAENPEIFSINASTGILTDSLRLGSGVTIAADNMLYYFNQKGEEILLSYNDGKIEKISSFKIRKGSAQFFSHPVIHKGVLYQRHGKVLMAFDIRKR